MLTRLDCIQSLHALVAVHHPGGVAVDLVWDRSDPDAIVDWVTDVLADYHGIAKVTLQTERRPCDRAAAVPLADPP